jgi:predicted nucleic acid-binding Zn ribbon protein
MRAEYRRNVSMLTDLLMLVPQMLRHAGDSDELREQAVFAAWLVAAGGPIRKVTAPVRLERKTLIVAVADATWRTQLMSMRGQALFKLNSLLGAPLVTSIEFVVNPHLIAREAEVTREVKFIAPEKQALPLRGQAERIPDPDIRATFLRAAGKCLERRMK